jgi:hypothetical protein
MPGFFTGVVNAAKMVISCAGQHLAEGARKTA